MQWSELQGLEKLASPCLLVAPAAVQANIDRMIAAVQDPARLRPHVKTHKMPAIVALQRAAGIDKCKVATLAEAEMAATAGVRDLLWAYPPVGPNLGLLERLIERFPETSFAVTVDDPETLGPVAKRFANGERPLRVFIDIDCGMHRTGVAMGAPLEDLGEAIQSQAGLKLAGWHVYDGHLHQPSAVERRVAARQIIDALQQTLQTGSWPADLTIVGGGSPTFATWASETAWECSPGTPLLWDVGYGSDYPELGFEVAAVLLTRVISRPAADQLCFDLGYKAVAAENPLDRRLVLPAFPEAELVGQSEEHLVLRTPRAAEIPIGSAAFAFPKHICPTVALHDRAFLVEDQRVSGAFWEITARRRQLRGCQA